MLSTLPRLYDPSVRRFAWPVAMLMLIGWVGLVALGKPVPIWLEGLAAANLFITSNCRAPSDRTGELRLRAMALSAQWFFGVLIAIWFTFKIATESELTFHARTLVMMVLGFSACCEAAYSYLLKDALGWRWLIGLTSGVLVAVLVALSF
ncbi:MAG: hypothetical protein KF843_14650 [Flavobacteriales bacterium]|nr:hypothetical protein [Flavobacteriales bacterium]